MDGPALALFALGGTRPLGERVASRLGVVLAAHEEREFEWGQHKARPLESVRGRDVFVLHSLHGDREQSVNDKLCRLLFFAGAVRDAGAARVTAVVPFLCYSRKDRRTKARDPVTTRYVAALFEAVGVDCVVTLEVHNEAAFENAFRCRTEHLEAHATFAAQLAPRLAGRDVVVASPDVGGVKRAERHREALARCLGRAPRAAFVEKRRSEGVVGGGSVVGDVAGATVLLVDDLVSAATTLARAATACRAAGAREVLAAVAHGVFVAAASETLARAPLERLFVLDHIPVATLGPQAAARIESLDASVLLAEAVGRLHDGEARSQWRGTGSGSEGSAGKSTRAR